MPTCSLRGTVDLESKKVFTVEDSGIIPLENFVDKSGFGCVRDWINAYRAFAGRKSKIAHLYKVVVMKVHRLEGE